jgi:hypothetical protein
MPHRATRPAFKKSLRLTCVFALLFPIIAAKPQTVPVPSPTPKGPQTPAAGPSLVETITYINGRIGPRKLSLPGDQTQVVIEETSPCSNPQFACGIYESFPIRIASKMIAKSSFDPNQGAGSVTIDCPVGYKCIDKRYAQMTGKEFLSSAKTFEVNRIILQGTDNPEMNDRLVRAIQRLLYLLDDQYQKKNQREDENSNDPFRTPRK